MQVLVRWFGLAAVMWAPVLMVTVGTAEKRSGVVSNARAAAAHSVVYLPVVRSPGLYAGCSDRRLVDSDGDGSIDVIAETYFDALGEVAETRSDRSADGRFDWIQLYRRDARGLLERVDYDTDGDGDFEGNERYEYDRLGRLTAWSRFDRESNRTTARTRYVYNLGFDVARKEKDLDGDGSLDEVVSYEYDLAQHVIVEQTDLGGDGDVDAATHYAWQGDLLLGLRHYVDAELMSRIQYYYNGRRLMERTETYVNDRMVDYTVYQYNSADQETQRRLYIGGHFESESEQQYDMRGRVSLRRVRIGDSISYVEHHTYVCT